MKRLLHLFGAKKKFTVDISSQKIFHQELKIERSRTHRNGHGFSIVVFDLDKLQSNKKDVGRLIKSIRSRIRDIDHVGWYSNKRIGVILPYTSLEGANKFSTFIIKSVDDLQNKVTYKLITYPPEKKSFVEISPEPIMVSM